MPTSDGREQVTNNATYTFGALHDGEPFGGPFHGDRYDGTFQVTPEDGDCFSRPITKIQVVVNFTLPR